MFKKRCLQAIKYQERKGRPTIWTIYGSSKKCSTTETKKTAGNTKLSSELDSNDDVMKFWNFESKIAESAD